MMKYILTILLALSLSGCVTMWKPEKEVVVKQEYIIRIPPAETMKLPEPVQDIDVDTADEGVVAKWLVAKEKYTEALEDKLKEIAKFFVDEQKKLEAK